jgi:sec-independent protein translocase protein TatC
MSIGEHLDELRGHLLRGLVGAAVGVCIGVAVAHPVLEFICQPVVTVLQANGLDARLQVLNPQEAFVNWIKVGLFTGLILAAPYALWEIWRFVCAGLYPRERGLVGKLVPPSLILFACGVVFFFFIVLPVALNFFVGFAGKLTIGSVTPNAFQRLVLGAPETERVAPRPVGPRVAVLDGSPEKPEPGDQWFDTAAGEFRVAVEDGVYAVPMKKVGEHHIVQSQFRLREYITFVGMLALSFGAAFQMPVVVVFLVWAGIFSTGQMKGARKYVIFGIAVAAAVLTPTPDALSMGLLAVPMLALFEAGLLLGGMIERKREPRPT